MGNKIEISREQLQRWEWLLDSPAKRQELLEELRAILVDGHQQPEDSETEIIVPSEVFDEFETALENRPLQTNLAAQRLLRRPNRWS